MSGVQRGYEAFTIGRQVGDPWSDLGSTPNNLSPDMLATKIGLLSMNDAPGNFVKSMGCYILLCFILLVSSLSSSSVPSSVAATGLKHLPTDITKFETISSQIAGFLSAQDQVASGIAFKSQKGEEG